MPATAEQVEVAQFYSRGREEMLVRRPQIDTPTMTGGSMRVQNPVRYSFAPNGRLSLRPGQDMLPDGPPDPETGEPSMQDAIAWLTEGFDNRDGTFGPHPQFNVRVWREGHEPDRPRPLEGDFLAEVTAAAAGLQVEPIRELLEAEVAGHNRPVLVKAAENAIAQVEQMTAALAEREGAKPKTAKGAA